MATPNPAFSFLNTIKYTFADDTTTSDAMICLDHDHALLKPQVISTWMPSGVGSKPGKRVIFAETQVCDYFMSFFFRSRSLYSFEIKSFLEETTIETKLNCQIFKCQHKNSSSRLLTLFTHVLHEYCKINTVESQ